MPRRHEKNGRIWWQLAKLGYEVTHLHVVPFSQSMFSTESRGVRTVRGSDES
ncbi:hypothetical protein BURKHO8Y_340012 [Burkholderia sp. 8Y]|nr:hypothetical protein BURKHO8Y_340012 [Burkholderia sp. 8Y]